MEKFVIEVKPEDVHKVADWIATRGGVAKWVSIDLSDPSASCLTPATTEGVANPKPSWKYANEPVVIDDPAQVGVYVETLFKAFPVGLRMGRNGTMLKITDGAQRRLNRTLAECAKKHGNAHYRKGVLDIDGASIGVFYVSDDNLKSLPDFLKG